MSLPARYPMLGGDAIRQGSRWRRVFTARDANGDPFYNLTGYGARAQIRRSIDDTAVLVDLTTGNGGIALGGAAGTVTVTISATATAALGVGPAVWDLELIPASGEADAFAFLYGPVEIVRQVTR